VIYVMRAWHTTFSISALWFKLDSIQSRNFEYYKKKWAISWDKSSSGWPAHICPDIPGAYMHVHSFLFSKIVIRTMGLSYEGVHLKLCQRGASILITAAQSVKDQQDNIPSEHQLHCIYLNPTIWHQQQNMGHIPFTPLMT
jgi:hypothetical protein